MRWTAVVNPTAGRGRTRKLLPELQRVCSERQVPVHVASDVADGQQVARHAFDRGDGVVACGGDGTVNTIAAVAAEHDGPLAIVPTGAGNDLARHLGIDTKQPLRAIELLDDAHLTRIDLGHATTADGTATTFTTVANAGFDGEANRWANDVRWLRGTPLYVLAMLRTLGSYRPRAMCVRVDDNVWEGDAWLVAVGNTRWYAGGMMITPDAESDDGLLDVCIVEGSSTRTLLRRFPRVFKGTHTSLDEVTMLRGAAVEVAGPDSGLQLWASGERVGPLPARLTATRSAFPVVVPRPTRP